MNNALPPMLPEELEFLDRAVAYLERPSFLFKVANLLGKPIETIGNVLPSPVRNAAASSPPNR